MYVPLVCKPYCLDHQPCTSDACWRKNADDQRQLEAEEKLVDGGSGPLDRRMWRENFNNIFDLMLSYQCSVSRNGKYNRVCRASFVNKLL